WTKPSTLDCPPIRSAWGLQLGPGDQPRRANVWTGAGPSGATPGAFIDRKSSKLMSAGGGSGSLAAPVIEKPIIRPAAMIATQKQSDSVAASLADPGEGRTSS